MVSYKFGEDQMKIGHYTLTELARNEMFEFAQYTVASRAIPNMIDGMKPVQRFYLYSSLRNSSKEYKKVSAIAGVISDYGYNHAEASAESAGKLMAATWNNNICLVLGRGSFGTRQVQEAGASRYVYTRKHGNFDKYIKDMNLCPVHADPEHLPPAYYLPVLPLVVINGAKGIATGFATTILPKREDDVVKAIREYIKTGDIKTKIRICFPEFKGTTYFDRTEKKWFCKGTWNKPTKTTLIINEIPYGFDREGYIKVLDKLEDNNEIVGYEDQCDSDGFKFEVKLKQQTSSKWNDDKIEKKFQLIKPFSENITVIDWNGNLREYDDCKYLIKDFVDFRLVVLGERISESIKKQTEILRWLNVKIQFINAVLDEKIKFKNQKKDQVCVQIKNHTDAIDEDLPKLLALNILSLTHEQVKDLEKQIREQKKILKYWQGTTPELQFEEDLVGVAGA